MCLALIGVSALFGFFVGGMFFSSIRYIITNMTSIDILRRRQVYQLAVSVPHGTASFDGRFSTVTYPLPSSASSATPDQPANRLMDGASDIPNGEKVTPRDLLATRTFAILRTQPGENPWDLGWRGNWRSVMGNNLLECLLPLRQSPCTRHEDMRGMYQTGPLISTLRRRYGLEVQAELPS